MITVTKSYIPDRIKFQSYIDQIFESSWLTNRGPLVRLLEDRLRERLRVKHLILVANGSIALQIAYKALELNGDVITTPFSFAATTSTIAWENLNPVFADIDPLSLNIDPQNIERLVTNRTSAILPVHVFGNPCNVDEIDRIAKNYGLRVIYDGAHAFDVKLRNESIFRHGDISTLSFHATKIFHTCEGGALVTNDDDLANRIRLLINFGFSGIDKIDCLGTNAKMNELEAAMGLCVLDDIDQILTYRKQVFQWYSQLLSNHFLAQVPHPDARQNYSYIPILLDKESTLLRVADSLAKNEIFPRRYFYPSLDTLPYLAGRSCCPISRDVASRILCLPTYFGLSQQEVERISAIVSKAL